MPEDDLWSRPPRADQIEQLTQQALNPPAEVVVEVKLSGLSAARFHFARQLLMSVFTLSQEDADAYLVRAGAEREIERLLQSVQLLDAAQQREEHR